MIASSSGGHLLNTNTSLGLHCLRNGVNSSEGGAVGHFGEDAIATVRFVQVLVLLQVDEELGVAIVGNIPMCNGAGAACVRDPDAILRLISRQVAGWRNLETV